MPSPWLHLPHLPETLSHETTILSPRRRSHLPLTESTPKVNSSQSKPITPLTKHIHASPLSDLAGTNCMQADTPTSSSNTPRDQGIPSQNFFDISPHFTVYLTIEPTNSHDATRPTQHQKNHVPT